MCLTPLLLELGVIPCLILPLSFLTALFLLCLTLLERVSYGENSYLYLHAGQGFREALHWLT